MNVWILKNGNIEEKTCECAHRNIYTVSKKTKNSFDIRKKIELIIASEKYPLYIHKDQQHTQIRYYLSIYSYKNIKKKDKTIVYWLHLIFKYKPLLRRGL